MIRIEFGNKRRRGRRTNPNIKQIDVIQIKNTSDEL